MSIYNNLNNEWNETVEKLVLNKYHEHLKNFHHVAKVIAFRTMLQYNKNSLDSLLETLELVKLYYIVSFKTNSVEKVLGNPLEMCNIPLDEMYQYYITSKNLYRIDNRLYAILW